MIRESLKTLGLLAELEVRAGSTGAGRPMKFVVPTLQAFELLGKEPPPGRGGVIHRHLQRMIADAAAATGYTAKCEKDLGNSAIVDVHMENWQEKIAVEIAVMSKPSREVAHIRQCLQAGYDKVCVVFVDPRLLARTTAAVAKEFTDAEWERVQLVPVHKVAGVVSDATDDE
jgi:hypothetical protein